MLSNRPVLLRWMFFGSGLLLLLGRSIVEDVLTNVWNLVRGPFPDDLHETIFVSILSTVILTGAILSLITAWGLKRNRPWSRSIGICTSLVLLVLFPLTTIQGMLGLQALAAGPLESKVHPSRAALARKSKDYWVSKRHSPAQQVILGILGVVGLNCLGAVGGYARALGMHGRNLGWVFLLAFLLFDVTVHELGHATVGWALYNRLRAINIGPFTFRDFGRGYQFHFDWRRILASGGFVSSAPTTGSHLRARLIAEIAGGPGAALLTSVVMACVFLWLPGTRFEIVWWIPGFLAVICFFDGAANLIPLGYSDGSMLFHLILWTQQGRRLLDLKHLAQINEEATAAHDQGDFGRERELRAAALERALEGGELNAFAIAMCHERLGRTLSSLEDSAGAEVEFRKCLAFEAECALENALLVNCWAQLQQAAFERHHVAEVGQAYPPLLRGLEKRRKEVRDRVELAVTSIMLGRAHLRAASFEKALEESQVALRTIPPGNDRLMLCAEAWSIRPQAELGLLALDFAHASAARAAEILRCQEIPPARRNFAWVRLGDLGEDLWRAGESETSVDLLREAIAQLESCGVVAAAAQYRIQLAIVYRELGNAEEAWRCLPEEDELSIYSLRSLLAERARLHLAAGRPEDVIHDCHRLLALWKSEPVESAIAQSVLAEACLEAGDYPQAASLARQAADALGPWQHCQAASCLITRALAEWRVGGEWAQAYANEAERLIQSDLLLRPAAKARLLDAQSSRLKRHGRPEEARDFDTGVTSEPAAALV